MAKKVKKTSKKASAKKKTVKKAVKKSAAKKSAKKTVKKSTAKKTAKKASKKKSSPKKTVKKAVKKKAAKKKSSVKKTTKKAVKKKSASKKSARQKSPSRKRKRRKSRLTRKELEHFKNILLLKRREIVGDVNHMENEALKKSRLDAAGDLSSMPIHMADMGTDNFEQEFSLGLMDSERKLLHEINGALQRIYDGVYGLCEGTGKEISKARLEANPWAKYCIEYAIMVEKGQVIEGETIFEDEDDDYDDYEEAFEDEDDDESKEGYELLGFEDMDEKDEEDDEEF